MTALADAGTVAVGVADSTDAGGGGGEEGVVSSGGGGGGVVSSPADLAGVGAVDVATLADAGMVTVGVADLAVAGLVIVGMTDLADTGMVFPADLAGAVTIGVAPRAVGGMTFPADPAGAVAVGVAGLVNVVDVPKCGGDVSWDDRMLPGNGRRTWTHTAGRELLVCWRCLVEVSGGAPVAGCSGSLSTCSSNQSCPAVDYMTCWENLKL